MDIAVFRPLFLIAFLDSAIGSTPRQGRWGNWSKPSPCSVTCGSGTMSIRRQWIPGDGETVPKNTTWYTKTYYCTPDSNLPCPRNGKWSGWTAWSPCTKACGTGTRTRQRECVGKLYGGKNCDGSKTNTTSCKKEPCPALPLHFDMGQCTDQNYTCASKKMCILSIYHCDWTVQCHDGSDEMNCSRRSIRYGGVRYELHGRGPSYHAGVTLIPVALALAFSIAVTKVFH